MRQMTASCKKICSGAAKGGSAAGPQPPLIAVSTKTSTPGSSGVSSLARSPSTKMLMCRRTAGVESQSRSRIPGQRASSPSIISATVAASSSTRRTEPGKQVDEHARQAHHDRQRRAPWRVRTAPCGDRSQASTTSVSTEEIDRQVLGDRRPAVALVGAGEQRAACWCRNRLRRAPCRSVAMACRSTPKKAFFCGRPSRRPASSRRRRGSARPPPCRPARSGRRNRR